MKPIDPLDFFEPRVYGRANDIACGVLFSLFIIVPLIAWLFTR